LHLEQTLLPLIAAHGLPIVTLMVFIAELGLPTGMSPKVGLLVAGSMALQNPPELLLGVAAVTTANVLGTMVLYTVSRSGGTRIVGRFQRNRQANGGNVLERWRARLGGHDAAAVFVGRIVPMVRIYVTIASGLARIPVRPFLLGSAPAGLLWSGIPLSLGYYFRGSVQDFTASGSQMSHLFFIAVPMISVVTGLIWLIKRRFTSVPALA
jgi:membrane protein DedA with SNARE-associated domain